jgi:hypothetical protein
MTTPTSLKPVTEPYPKDEALILDEHIGVITLAYCVLVRFSMSTRNT